LNISNPKTIKTKKPIKAIRMFSIFPMFTRPIKLKKPVKIFKIESSNHTTPVKNPRKSPKMLQEE
jgi:hypothetical protein